MSSDDSFFDEDIEKASPIHVSDRVLRSSSISSESNQTLLMDFNKQNRLFMRNSNDVIPQARNSSHTFQKNNTK